MDDSTLWRIWFLIAIICCILTVILPLIGIPID